MNFINLVTQQMCLLNRKALEATDKNHQTTPSKKSIFPTVTLNSLHILGKKSIAQSANASIIKGQRVHISMDIVGEKNVIYETISKTSSKTSAGRFNWLEEKNINSKEICNTSSLV